MKKLAIVCCLLLAPAVWAQSQIGSSSSSGGGGATMTYANKFGAKGGAVIICDATFTNTSPTVISQNFTQNNDVPFSASMVGWHVLGTNWTCSSAGSLAASTSLVPAATTVSAVGSSSSLTMSANATGTCTSGASTPICTLVLYQFDDTTALNSAWQAAINSCSTTGMPGTLVLDNTNYVSGPIVPTTSQPCNQGFDTRSPVSKLRVTGAGPHNSVIVSPGGIAGGSCATGVSGSNACYFATDNGNAVDGAVVKYDNFGLFGLGLACTSCAANSVLELGDDAEFDSANVTGYSGFSALGMVRAFTNEWRIRASHLTLVASGTSEALHTNKGFTLSQSNIISNGTCWHMLNDSQASNQSSGNVYTCGAGAANGIFVDIAGGSCNLSGPVWTSTGDMFETMGSTTAGVETACYANLDGDTFVFSNSITALKADSGGTLKVKNLGIFETGNTINIASGGTFIDECGNQYFAGTTFTINGAWLNEACSGNAVLVTAAKTVLSAGWGTTAAVTALSGGDAPIQFTVTNSGTGQGASPTITYTFPTPYPVAPFSCTATQTGGTNATGTFTSSALSATGVTFTFSLTPTASSTEIVQVTCVTP